MPPSHRNTISLSRKQSKRQGKPTNLPYWFRVALVWGTVLAFSWPVFRSGLRSNITFAEFIFNHTIFGPEPEYIPEEYYARIFGS